MQQRIEFAITKIHINKSFRLKHRNRKEKALFVRRINYIKLTNQVVWIFKFTDLYLYVLSVEIVMLKSPVINVDFFFNFSFQSCLVLLYMF